MSAFLLVRFKPLQSESISAEEIIRFVREHGKNVSNNRLMAFHIIVRENESEIELEPLAPGAFTAIWNKKSRSDYSIMLRLLLRWVRAHGTKVRLIFSNPSDGPGSASLEKRSANLDEILALPQAPVNTVFWLRNKALKNYWTSICEEGHRRVILREADDEETPEDLVCDYGHAVVTLRKVPVADIAQITLQPRAELDEVSKKIHHENDYYIVISSLLDGRSRTSSRCYGWDEFVGGGILDRFRNVPFEMALKYLDLLERKRDYCGSD